jgi:hypothetical protein
MKTAFFVAMTLLLAAFLIAPTKIGLSYPGGLSDAEAHTQVTYINLPHLLMNYW